MSFVLVVFSLLMVYAMPAHSQGWEWLNPLPQGNDLNELEYLGNNQLYSTGYSGISIGSTDNGVTWAILEPGDNPNPEIVDFLSPENGFGITRQYSLFGEAGNNRIFRTGDGGDTWNEVYFNAELNLNDISFVSTQIGWVIGSLDSNAQLVILHTTDGGESWSESVSDSTESSAKLFFLNDQEGWISLWRSTAHTTDGGTTWEWYESPYWMYFDMVFTDSQNGWGAGFNDIYHTSDGAQNWTPLNVPLIDTEWARSIAVIDANHIWTVTASDGVHITNEHVLHTSNGGTSWERVSLPRVSNLNKVVFADAQRGWICGEDGLVYQTVDGGTNWVQRCGDRITDGSVYFNAVSFADRQTGWITASRTYWSSTDGTIYYSTNGGVDWVVQFRDSLNEYYDIEAISSTNAWAVGSNVIHTTDGGAHWEEVSIEGFSSSRQIICDGDQIIWIAGEWQGELYVYRSTDGGATWESHEVEFAFKFNGMAAAGVNDVWIASWADLDEGTVAHSSDGGVTWETQGDSLGYLYGIEFVDPLHGWANSSYGFVRTLDGGDSWTVLENGPDRFAERFQFLDTLNGWALGYDTYRTTDGGLTWETFTTRRDNWSGEIDFVDPTHGWLLGSNTLMRFDGSIFSTPEQPDAKPVTFKFLPAYPNPFNPNTTLAFDLPNAGRVRVDVFDVTGRLVQSLGDQFYTAGSHSLKFDGSGLSTGMYFARASKGSVHAVQKLLLLK